MKLLFLVSLPALIATGVAAAADPSGQAPPDRNEACMDRKVDSSSADCIIKDDGTPRHTYPPKRAPAKPTPKPAGSASSTTAGGSSSSR